MIKVIAVPYTIYQNEPSRPLPFIIELPVGDELEQERIVREIFIEHVCDDLDVVNDSCLVTDIAGDYGDYVFGDGDINLFLSIIEQ